MEWQQILSTAYKSEAFAGSPFVIAFVEDYHAGFDCWVLSRDGEDIDFWLDGSADPIGNLRRVADDCMEGA